MNYKRKEELNQRISNIWSSPSEELIRRCTKVAKKLDLNYLTVLAVAAELNQEHLDLIENSFKELQSKDKK